MFRKTSWVFAFANKATSALKIWFHKLGIKLCLSPLISPVEPKQQNTFAELNDWTEVNLLFFCIGIYILMWIMIVTMREMTNAKWDSFFWNSTLSNSSTDRKEYFSLHITQLNASQGIVLIYLSWCLTLLLVENLCQVAVGCRNPLLGFSVVFCWNEWLFSSFCKYNSMAENSCSDGVKHCCVPWHWFCKCLSLVTEMGHSSFTTLTRLFALVDVHKIK